MTIRAHLQRIRAAVTAWRGPILALALVGVAAGCIISFRDLGIAPASLQPLPLLIILLVIIPASIAYSALNMMLMGHAAGVPVGFAQGVKVSVFAQVAEILPIPGGAIVRTAALVRAGSPAVRSAELVIAFSLLWIACGAAGAGLALAKLGWPALALAAGGAVGALTICGWLGARFGAFVAIAAVVLRGAGVALVAARLMLAFAVIGVTLPWLDSATFAFATILGSAAALIPAGLGVSEGLSALIAGPAGVAPAAAFLAAALSRLLGFAVNSLLAVGYGFAARAARAEPAHG